MYRHETMVALKVAWEASDCLCSKRLQPFLLGQKNWTVVRRVIGYDRFSSRAAFKAPGDVYTLLRLYINFFQPVSRLVKKSRHGAKVYKVYDTAQTPYHRLLRSGVLTEDKEGELADMYGALNPVTLLQQIRQSVEQLRVLAER